MQFLPDGTHVIIGGGDGTIRQWRVEEGTGGACEVWKQTHFEGEMKAAVVSKDGKWIVLAHSFRVTIRDATTRENMGEFLVPEEITALDVSPDALKIATGSQDGTVFIWSLETRRRIAGPLKQDRSVLSVRFSPTGDRLATAGPDFSIHVWNICSGTGLSMTCVPTDPAYSLIWSNDGRRIFAGFNQGSIQSFDVSGSTSATKKWAGHPHFDSVSTLCLSNNGRFIVSASSAGCLVKIWDVLSQSEILSLRHTSEVLAAEISLDDSHLVVGAKDGKTHIWNLRKCLQMSYFFHVGFKHLW